VLVDCQQGNLKQESTLLEAHFLCHQDQGEASLMRIFIKSVNDVSDDDLKVLAKNLLIEDDIPKWLDENTSLKTLKEKKLELRKLMAKIIFEDKPKFKDLSPKGIEKVLLKEAQEDCRIKTMEEISKGLYCKLGKEEPELSWWDNKAQKIEKRVNDLPQRKWEELKICVEGIVDAKNVIKNLHCRTNSLLKKLLEEWVEKADLIMLKKFVFAASSAYGLKAEGIFVVEGNELIEFHTCSNEIDINISDIEAMHEEIYAEAYEKKYNKKLEKKYEKKFEQKYLNYKYVTVRKYKKKDFYQNNKSKNEQKEFDLSLASFFKEKIEFAIEEAVLGNFEIS
jgi:hypothetical protein